MFVLLFKGHNGHNVHIAQEYIEGSLESGGKVEKGKVPWRHLLTSVPLWGCVLGKDIV